MELEMKHVFDGGDIEKVTIDTNKNTGKVQIHLTLDIENVPDHDITKLITMSKRKLEAVTLISENIVAM